MYLEELSDKIWKTKNARFMAAKRMRRCHISSTVSVALLSASIIAVNMLAFLKVADDVKTLITIATVILSTFALVMSLLVSLMRYEHRSENYHQCGIELENLNQKLKIRIQELASQSNNSPKEDNEHFLEHYYNILGRHNLNHTDLDYEYSSMKADRCKDYGWMKYVKCWLKWNLINVNTVYCLIAFLSIVAVVIAFVEYS